jgi:uncharacterized SAM-binding protein YcdF (DUF218 family)
MHKPERSRAGASILPLLFLLVLSALCAALWIWRQPLMAFPGAFLDAGQPPVKADAAVVLAGGYTGERILKAAALAREGLVPIVLVSGPRIFYEVPECEISIPFAVRKGFPRELFVCVPNNARSTMAEAAALEPALRARHVRRFLLVTTAYHTRRAAGIFRQALHGYYVIPVSADSPDFGSATWYRQREGRKNVFFEWAKLLTWRFGA